MDWIQVILLSLIQGLTEFLPISSSAHLVLPAQLTDWPDQGLAFDVAVHFGTLLAAMAYFRQDLMQMLAAFTRAPALLSNIGWRPTLLQSAAHDEHLDFDLQAYAGDLAGGGGRLCLQGHHRDTSAHAERNCYDHNPVCRRFVVFGSAAK